MADQTPEEKAEAEIAKRVTDAVAAETAKWEGVKQKNVELLGKNQSLAARAKVIGDRTPEDVQADLDLAAKFKEDKAKAEGNFEELKKIQAAELAKRDEAIKARDGRIYDLVAKQGAIEAITAAGGKPKKLLGEVLKSIKVVEVGGELVAQVVDAKGNPRIVDGQATPMSIAQLVDIYKADEDYGVDFAASGASGSGARNEAGSRVTGGAVVIPKAATPQEYRRMKADAEKRGVPYTIGQ